MTWKEHPGGNVYDTTLPDACLSARHLWGAKRWEWAAVDLGRHDLRIGGQADDVETAKRSAELALPLLRQLRDLLARTPVDQ